MKKNVFVAFCQEAYNLGREHTYFNEKERKLGLHQIRV